MDHKLFHVLRATSPESYIRRKTAQKDGWLGSSWKKVKGTPPSKRVASKGLMKNEEVKTLVRAK